MRSRSSWQRLLKTACILIVVGASARPSPAQPAPCSTAPSAFAVMCSELEGDVSSFDTTVSSQWNGTPSPVAFGAELVTADCNRGLATLLAPATLAGVKSQLDALALVGVQSVTFAVSFPILYQPFYQYNHDPQDYAGVIGFYQSVMSEARSRGMKVVIESSVMFPAYATDLPLAAYYATLTGPQVTAGRAQVAQTVALTLQPDWLNLGSEPDTEAALLGLSAQYTPQQWAMETSTILAQLRAAGVSGKPLIGGGIGTWQTNGTAYLEALTATGLDFIDLHVYAVNLGFLSDLTTYLDMAHAAGKGAALSELWLKKLSDAQLQGLTDWGIEQQMSGDTERAQQTFSFWSALDSQYLGALVKLAHWKNLYYISPFEVEIFSYLDYNQDGSLSPSQILAAENTAASAAMRSGTLSATGQAYAADIAPCTYSVDRNGGTIPGAGGSASLSVQTGPFCSWTVSGLPAWITGTTAGMGPGTASLSATANPGAVRSATISVAGAPVTITQDGSPCTYALSFPAAAFPSAGGTGMVAVITGSACPWSVSSVPGWVAIEGPSAGVGSGAVSYSVAADTWDARSGAVTIAGLPFAIQQVGASVTGWQFVPVTPCRVADTRNTSGPFGGPTMTAGLTRSFAIPQSGCGIPSTAQAYSLNVTAVPNGALGYLTLFPTGQPQPYVSTLNSWGGIVVANAAIVPAGTAGAVSVFVSNPTDVILDIDGYFDSAGSAFYSATPCRIADTRNPAGEFGGPSISAGQTRDFPIPLSSCGILAGASAYAMNVTVVPDGPLGFLTTWQTGQPLPYVSTLNSWTGKVVANAAIVPAGTNESISVFVSNPTDAILDIDGYFAPPGNTGALSFYPVTPCRVADTRNAAGPFGGPEMAANSTRSFAIPASGCFVPSTAAAYSVNITVVPDAALGYLSAWSAGAAQPYVSTLNSWDGSVVANAAIVSAGTTGAISIYVTDPTHVILDIDGYFAP